MAELAALTLELQNSLRDFAAGHWVAIAPATASVIADEADAETALQAARKAGCADPIVIRVPDRLPAENVEYLTGNDAPAGVIFDAWQRGRVVPFLGAGASLVGGLPTANDLIHLMAERTRFPISSSSDLDLAKVSSFYELRAGRDDLQLLLREALEAQKMPKPGPLHRFIASTVGCRAKLIMTTNYDTLIEDALSARGIPYDLLVYPTDTTGDIANAALWVAHGQKPTYQPANTLAISFERVVVYKMHGSLATEAQWDSFVITEDDYMQFLARMVSRTAIPTAVLEYLPQRQLLFLGYGLRDWNLRVVLQNLNHVLTSGPGARRRPPSWAIQRRPSPVECALWQTRNIQIFNQDLDRFAEEMAKLAPGD